MFVFVRRLSKLSVLSVFLRLVSCEEILTYSNFFYIFSGFLNLMLTFFGGRSALTDQPSRSDKKLGGSTSADARPTEEDFGRVAARLCMRVQTATVSSSLYIL